MDTHIFCPRTILFQHFWAYHLLPNFIDNFFKVPLKPACEQDLGEQLWRSFGGNDCKSGRERRCRCNGMPMWMGGLGVSEKLRKHHNQRVKIMVYHGKIIIFMNLHWICPIQMLQTDTHGILLIDLQSLQGLSEFEPVDELAMPWP